jgi:hypothetical protein
MYKDGFRHLADQVYSCAGINFANEIQTGAYE